MASEINQIAAGIQILVTGDGPQTEAIQIQEQTQAQAQADSSEYILPESSERALTDADVQGMSYDDLQMAINEIYARHGRIFGTDPFSNILKVSPGIRERQMPIISATVYSAPLKTRIFSFY